MAEVRRGQANATRPLSNNETENGAKPRAVPRRRVLQIGRASWTFAANPVELRVRIRVSRRAMG
jgi:hypothetical protein